MRAILTLLLTLVPTLAAAETIRLHCPTSTPTLTLFTHDWVLDLDARTATLAGETSSWIRPGKHEITAISDDRIVISDGDPKSHWSIDRYDMSVTINWTETEEAHILARNCRVLKPGF